MWLIPKKTKVKTEIFRGISIADMIIGAVAMTLIVLQSLSSFSGTAKWVIGGIIAFITVFLLIRIDNEPNYIFILHILNHLTFTKHYARFSSDELMDKQSQYGDFEAGADVVFEEQENNAAQTDALDKQQLKQIIKEEKRILKDPNATKEEKDAVWKARAARSAEKVKNKREAKDGSATWEDMGNIIGFTDIQNQYIVYGSEYYGSVVELDPVEFRFFSKYRRDNSIKNGIGQILNSINMEYAANIVKIERPLHYENFEANEFKKIEDLRYAYEMGVLKEDEFRSRVEIIYDRIHEIQGYMNDNKVIVPHYYLVFYDSDKGLLENMMAMALDKLVLAEIPARRLYGKDLALFLKYSNSIDFDENVIDNLEPEKYATWAMPEQIDVRMRTVEVDKVITRNLRVFQSPTTVGDAWLAYVMSVPATKVVVKCRPMDRQRSIRDIDRSLSELKVQYNATNVESKLLELRDHIASLEALLETLQNDMETLLEVNIYVTCYDIAATNADPRIDGPKKSSRANMSNMQKAIKRYYAEDGFKLRNHDFEQLKTFVGTQINGYDPYHKDAMGIPSNSLAAAYPWVYAKVCDENGIKLGVAEGVPAFFDFFRRDNERINSNMVIVGKSGSGKSYATKSLLANLAADDSKIFILDPENEYAELAKNLHGQFINVGNAQYGRLNPFHIMTSLDDEEDETTVSGSYATHLQFLEEFFRQIIPDCERDAMEYLNSLVDRMYLNMGITAETNFKALRPEDYPIFDDLYDTILEEFQQTDNEYIRRMLRILMNYISKFSTGGRNANIWNGPSTITTEENFSVFNFQSLLANRNGTIANAQMLLVLKYIDNEIIKNRDYNLKNHTNRKIVVAIDEAHVFIDDKFPVALDFMYQMAKRIRKYNGMQIVITQNIKDFVGSEELARKSTAIINACQYSFIFALAPNDMNDLCTLYEKAGGINELEQEQIINASRGQAFTIMGPQSRTSFKVVVPDEVVSIFSDANYESSYFAGEEGFEEWDEFIGDSREIREQNTYIAEDELPREEEVTKPVRKSSIVFNEMTEEEAKDFFAKRLEEIGIDDVEEIPEPVAMEPVEEVALEPVDEEVAPEPVVEPEIEEFDAFADEFEEEVAPAPVDRIKPSARNKKDSDEDSDSENQGNGGGVSVQQEEIIQNVLQAQTNMFQSMEKVFAQFMENFANQQASMSAAANVQIPQAAAETTADKETEEHIETTQPEAEENSRAMEEENTPFSIDEALGVDTSDEDDDDELSLFDENGELNIMALLVRESERMKNITKIEQMEYDDEDTAEITLVDLQAYIMKA